MIFLSFYQTFFLLCSCNPILFVSLQRAVIALILYLCYFHNKRTMIAIIVVGLIVWFVVPLVYEEGKSRKKYKATVRMLCRIIGLAIIVGGILHYVL